MLGDDHLGNTLPIGNLKIFSRKIDKQHRYFSSVIGIYGARGVQYRNTMLERQATTRTHLSFVAQG